jgi:hypothetical protein
MATTSTKSGSARKSRSNSSGRKSRSNSSGTKSRSSSSGTKSRSSSSARSRGSRRSASSNGDSDRYRRAAEDALQQLDWAIGYLHGIKKTGISKALAKNRSYIRRGLLGEPEEPLPGQQTDET